MLIPKVALSTLDLCELKRFMITGLTHINVDDASLTAAEIQEKILNLTRSKDRLDGLQTFRNIIVGPVPAEAIDTITALMNHGVEYIYVNGTDQDIHTVLSDLKPQRVVVPHTYEVRSNSEVEVEVVPGGVFMEFNGTSMEEFCIAGVTLRAMDVWKNHGLVIISVTEPTITAINAEELNRNVGLMHHRTFLAPVLDSIRAKLGIDAASASGKSDYPIHILANASMPTANDPTSASASNSSNPNSNPNAAEKADHLCVAKSLISCLKTDRPDGLYATVVVDEHNQALGFVYSSDESITVALETGKGVYFSRSRKKLWRKGETSGAVQMLRSIRFDCDADALKFTVVQKGDPAAFCHKQVRGCWEGEMEGLGGLFRTLESRRDNTVEGSYTKRLFTERGLLLKKMLEEVQELEEAVNEKDPAHVAEETADVLYFALTACCAGGATLLDVEEQLDKRTFAVKRRRGDAKKHRVAAAEQILNAKK